MTQHELLALRHRVHRDHRGPRGRHHRHLGRRPGAHHPHRHRRRAPPIPISLPRPRLPAARAPRRRAGARGPDRGFGGPGAAGRPQSRRRDLRDHARRRRDGAHSRPHPVLPGARAADSHRGRADPLPPAPRALHRARRREPHPDPLRRVPHDRLRERGERRRKPHRAGARRALPRLPAFHSGPAVAAMPIQACRRSASRSCGLHALRARRPGARSHALHCGRRLCRRLPLPRDPRSIDAHDRRGGLRRLLYLHNTSRGFEIDRTDARPPRSSRAAAAAPSLAPEPAIAGSFCTRSCAPAKARRPAPGASCAPSGWAARSSPTWEFSASACSRIPPCTFRRSGRLRPGNRRAGPHPRRRMLPRQLKPRQSIPSDIRINFRSFRKVVNIEHFLPPNSCKIARKQSGGKFSTEIVLPAKGRKALLRFISPAFISSIPATIPLAPRSSRRAGSSSLPPPLPAVVGDPILVDESLEQIVPSPSSPATSSASASTPATPARIRRSAGWRAQSRRLGRLRRHSRHAVSRGSARARRSPRGRQRRRRCRLGQRS
jgi:hypothetical protein